ncbi:gliding motility-associated C-terminal domain-containing protein [Flavihumibacter stibioxidans]|uniref:Gliding motility-associated C-terminal domain-containing protein n=1 Tax=Flavihumibacter stibioxidans TaxID=1834163 RepID=A0ABR7MDV8_9BACT|nr:gliding motility-associated C-terminal domain-containing protein [Flavihumibacter stibioxidans]MBC6493151.1 hypothetical protein [Flavihumibacter stibioxidans]
MKINNFFFAVLLFLPVSILAQINQVPLSTSCNSWLRIMESGAGVQIGDLDISGDKVTIEAKFNRTSPYSGPYVYAGDIVSKHKDPNDVNYLLRPGSAEVTTTNGYFITPQVCEFDLNKTYHVALVYDGTTLKFYRNGYLMSQVNCSGNLVLNNYPTTIGQNADNMMVSPAEGLIGFIDEVRIWKTARTANEIKANMDISLPSPATQNGLLAYYQFSSLVNSQGNPSWNGVLKGTATLNTTNPQCVTSTDSCNIQCNKEVDFGYRFSLCNPEQIELNSYTDDVKRVNWDFGNYGTSTILTPVVNLGGLNKALDVKLGVEFFDGCIAEIEKTIKIEANTEASPNGRMDTSVCENSDIIIRAPLAEEYCWKTGNGIFTENIQQHQITANSRFLYPYKRFLPGTNLVPNGGFEGGNISFSSEYSFNASGISSGRYWIGSNPQVWNPGISCNSTIPNSNMLLVNGETTPGKTIWKTSVPVQANSEYILRFNLQNLKDGFPVIRIFINGNKIDEAKFGKQNLCDWENYRIFWNSGNSANAEITFITGTKSGGETVFAIDNINFSKFMLFADSAVVKVESAPVINLVDAVQLCKGNSIRLNANTTSFNSINWFPNQFISDINSSITDVNPPNTFKYFVNARSPLGCESIDSVLVEVNPMPSFGVSPADSAVCPGIDFTLNAYGGTSYQWLMNDQPVNTGLSYQASLNESGVIKVIISDDLCNISDTLISTIEVFEMPQINVTKSNDIDCKQTTSFLTATGVDTFLWADDQSIVERQGNSIRVAPMQNTTYYFTGIDGNGCNSVDSIEVYVTPGAANEEFKMPNAFTPNGDNKNDCFGVSKLLALQEYKFTIWNRWGEIVFSTTNQAECWDGTLKGVRQNEGTYVFQVSGVSICGKVNKKGLVQLLR